MDSGRRRKHFLFSFDETGSVGGASCVKEVAVLNDKTEGALESYKV